MRPKMGLQHAPVNKYADPYQPISLIESKVLVSAGTAMATIVRS